MQAKHKLKQKVLVIFWRNPTYQGRCGVDLVLLSIAYVRTVRNTIFFCSDQSEKANTNQQQKIQLIFNNSDSDSSKIPTKVELNKYTLDLKHTLFI